METKRIYLRKLMLADSERIAELSNNENITKNTLSLPYPYTIADAKAWFESHKDNELNKKAYDFGIIDKERDDIIGVVGISNYQGHRGELGYWIGQAYWNQGYASEASALLIDYAFTKLNYNRIYARHLKSNPASGRVMQKLGMVYEGCQVEHEFTNGRFEDILLYGVTKTIYKNK